MSDKHHTPKKEKKLAQILKNRRIQRINLAEEEHGRQRDLEKEREEKLLKSARGSSGGERAKKADEPVWSARLQQVRDRNTGRLRTVDERWNRFAGTESGGGRGL